MAAKSYGTLYCMAERKLGRHYIKEWRKAKGLSLRKLADRLETEPGGEPLMTHSNLDRIEKGLQPFDEVQADAIAHALGITRLVLLEVHPEREADIIELYLSLNPKEREAAREHLNYLKSKRAG